MSGPAETYFARCADFVKIGQTRRGVAFRLAELRIPGNVIGPDAVRGRRYHLLAAVPAEDFPEREMHRRFKHLRVRGEFFRADPELLEFIAELEPAA